MPLLASAVMLSIRDIFGTTDSSLEEHLLKSSLEELQRRRLEKKHQRSVWSCPSSDAALDEDSSWSVNLEVVDQRSVLMHWRKLYPKLREALAARRTSASLLSPPPLPLDGKNQIGCRVSSLVHRPYPPIWCLPPNILPADRFSVLCYYEEAGDGEQRQVVQHRNIVDYTGQRCLVQIRREVIRDCCPSQGSSNNSNFQDHSLQSSHDCGSTWQPQRVLARWPRRNGCTTRVAAVLRSIDIETRKRQQWNEHVRQYQRWNEQAKRCLSDLEVSQSTTELSQPSAASPPLQADDAVENAEAIHGESLYWPALIRDVYGVFEGHDCLEDSFHGLGRLQQFDRFEDVLAIALSASMRLEVVIVYAIDETTEARGLRISPTVCYPNGAADAEDAEIAAFSRYLQAKTRPLRRRSSAALNDAAPLQESAASCPQLLPSCFPDVISDLNFSFSPLPPQTRAATTAATTFSSALARRGSGGGDGINHGSSNSNTNCEGDSTAEIGGRTPPPSQWATMRRNTLSNDPISLYDILSGCVCQTHTVAFLRPSPEVVQRARHRALVDLEQRWRRLRQALLDQIIAYEEEAPTTPLPSTILPDETAEPTVMMSESPLVFHDDHEEAVALETGYRGQAVESAVETAAATFTGLLLPSMESYESPYIQTDFRSSATPLPEAAQPVCAAEEELQRQTLVPQLQRSHPWAHDRLPTSPGPALPHSHEAATLEVQAEKEDKMSAWRAAKVQLAEVLPLDPRDLHHRPPAADPDTPASTAAIVEAEEVGSAIPRRTAVPKPAYTPRIVAIASPPKDHRGLGETACGATADAPLAPTYASPALPSTALHVEASSPAPRHPAEMVPPPSLEIGSTMDSASTTSLSGSASAVSESVRMAAQRMHQAEEELQRRQRPVAMPRQPLPILHVEAPSPLQRWTGPAEQLERGGEDSGSLAGLRSYFPMGTAQWSSRFNAKGELMMPSLSASPPAPPVVRATLNDTTTDGVAPAMLPPWPALAKRLQRHSPVLSTAGLAKGPASTHHFADPHHSCGEKGDGHSCPTATPSVLAFCAVSSSHSSPLSALSTPTIHPSNTQTMRSTATFYTPSPSQSPTAPSVSSLGMANERKYPTLPHCRDQLHLRNLEPSARSRAVEVSETKFGYLERQQAFLSRPDQRLSPPSASAAVVTALLQLQQQKTVLPSFKKSPALAISVERGHYNLASDESPPPLKPLDSSAPSSSSNPADEQQSVSDKTLASSIAAPTATDNGGLASGLFSHEVEQLWSLPRQRSGLEMEELRRTPMSTAAGDDFPLQQPQQPQQWSPPPGLLQSVSSGLFSDSHEDTGNKRAALSDRERGGSRCRNRGEYPLPQRHQHPSASIPSNLEVSPSPEPPPWTYKQQQLYQPYEPQRPQDHDGRNNSNSSGRGGGPWPPLGSADEGNRGRRRTTTVLVRRVVRRRRNEVFVEEGGTLLYRSPLPLPNSASSLPVAAPLRSRSSSSSAVAPDHSGGALQRRPTPPSSPTSASGGGIVVMPRAVQLGSRVSSRPPSQERNCHCCCIEELPY